MRLIDADALVEVLGDPHLMLILSREKAEETGEWGVLLRRMDVLRLVLSAPIFDAAPVVHARWLTSSDIPDTLICSLCGRRFDMYHFDQKDMPFCLCGAKMDGGAENV